MHMHLRTRLETKAHHWHTPTRALFIQRTPHKRPSSDVLLRKGRRCPWSVVRWNGFSAYHRRWRRRTRARRRPGALRCPPLIARGPLRTWPRASSTAASQEEYPPRTRVRSRARTTHGTSPTVHLRQRLARRSRRRGSARSRRGGRRTAGAHSRRSRGCRPPKSRRASRGRSFLDR
eukprot:42546-Pleurochrysis_carterae.AAC.4